MDWFLYDNSLCHEIVKQNNIGRANQKQINK